MFHFKHLLIYVELLNFLASIVFHRHGPIVLRQLLNCSKAELTYISQDLRMDTHQSTSESLRESIEELVSKKDIHGAVVQCEELEILTASTPFGVKHEESAKIHLALLLVLDDVNNGRHLWRRLPASVKGEKGELAALWGVGKCLWKRDMQGAQAILRGREWSGPVAPYVSLLRERLWERQLVIISTGFTSLPLERVASMLGCSIDEAGKECAKEGWEVQADHPRTVKPKPRPPTEKVTETTPDYLLKMARHITFLERQNQG